MVSSLINSFSAAITTDEKLKAMKKNTAKFFDIFNNIRDSLYFCLGRLSFANQGTCFLSYSIIVYTCSS
jgi:hypothetical protein